MDFFDKNCPVCSAAFTEEDDIVVCPRCGAPYHRECYLEKGKCIFPELHKEKKSWKSVYGTNNTAGTDEDDSDPTVCKNCGHKNSGDSIVCEKCGEFLTNNSNYTYNPPAENEEDIERIKEQIKNVTPVMGSANFYSNGTGFAFGFDENEDHDGVSAKELAEYVGNNMLYYMPVFSKLKRFKTGRFNFAAFLLNGVWYFYRKQYIKGLLISLLMLALNAMQAISMVLWSGSLWEKANNALGFPEHTPTYQEYFRWISENCTSTDMLLMSLPYILSFFSLIIMIVCGICANKGYYKKAIKTIKRIKDESLEDDEEQIHQEIIRKGGIHPGAAFTVITCETILSIGLTFFFM